MYKLKIYKALFLSISIILLPTCSSLSQERSQNQISNFDSKASSDSGGTPIDLNHNLISDSKAGQSSNYHTQNQLENNFDDSITIIGVGDIMLGTNYPSSNYLPPNDGKDLLKPVEHILQNADVTFGNLEGVLLTGEGDVKKCNDPTKCYAFKSPEHYAEYLKKAGFDVVSLANNHVGDFGNPGRKSTIRALKESGIQYAGLIDIPTSIFEHEGMTYGFCAFSPNNGTVSIHNYDYAKQIIQQLDEQCDIVIVSFHGGAEGSKYRNITRQTEMFLGENRGNPYQFARTVIDAGADIVFGHGPPCNQGNRPL